MLTLRELRRGGFDVHYRSVETAVAMHEALRLERWQLVICDYSMPSFSAPEALQTLKVSGIDVPLIVVSGTINEQIAIDTLKAGASDFMTKGNLARLLPAVDRELRDFAGRRERARAIEDLRASEERYRILFA